MLFKHVWPVWAGSGSVMALQPVDRLNWQFYDGKDLVLERDSLKEIRLAVEDWYIENYADDAPHYISEDYEVVKTDSDENVLQRVTIECEFDPAERRDWYATMRGLSNGCM